MTNSNDIFLRFNANTAAAFFYDNNRDANGTTGNDTTEDVNLRKMAEEIFSHPSLFRNFLRSYPELTQNLIQHQNEMAGNESIATRATFTVAHLQPHATAASAAVTDASVSSTCMRFVDLDPDPTNSPIVITIFAFIYVNIFLLGLIGNFSIVCLTYKHRHLRIVQNIFILNLALSDIIVCLLSLPFTPVTNVYKNWIFGQPICHLLPLVQAVSVFVSTFSLSIIAIDRYILVVKPYAHPLTIKQAMVLAVVLWIISVIVSIPYAYYMTLEEYPGYCGQFCSEHWPNEFVRRSYAVLVLTLQFLVPFGTMSVCYTTIFSKLKKRANSKLKKLNERSQLLSSKTQITESADSTSIRPVITPTNSTAKISPPDEEPNSPTLCHNQQRPLSNSNTLPSIGAVSTNANSEANATNHHGPYTISGAGDRQRTNLLAQQRRTTTILASMVLIFGLTWLPQNLVTLLIEYDDGILQTKNTNYTYLVSMITHSVAMTTNVANPILYAWLNPTFKRLFLEAFKQNKTNVLASASSSRHKLLPNSKAKTSTVVKANGLKTNSKQEAV